MQDILVVPCHLNVSGVDELGHKVDGLLSSFLLHLNGLEFLHQLLNLLISGLHLGVLVCGHLLVGLDLGLRSSALAAHFQHIRRDTFGHCRKEDTGK